MQRTRLLPSHPKIDHYVAVLRIEQTHVDQYLADRENYIVVLNRLESTPNEQAEASRRLDGGLEALRDAHEETKHAYSEVTQAKVWG